MERGYRVVSSIYDEKLNNRLKRAEGQLRGIQKMINENKDCKEVVTQLRAVRSSIDRIMGIVVAENLKECLTNVDLSEDEQDEKVAQAIQMIINK